ncbi:hypothetical protein CPT_Pipo_003 [Acinetobacter phage Pipo]|nr:hypothetical protein CPT_Pipo_003 [Acinetobacter phage Pipo]
MKQLVDHVQFCIKGEVQGDGSQYVLIEDGGKTYRRKIRYRYFSNYSIEYINFKNTQYQVNTVKSVSA